MRLKTTLLWMTAFMLTLVGCKKWEDHNRIDNQDLTKTLSAEISQRQNLSKFYEYLQKTGLDKELASSKTYTVFAPTNDALQGLDPSIIADTSRLRKFLGNHIANQTFFTRNAVTAVRVPMLNGKQVTFLNKQFDEANITEADKYLANGVLHVLDKIAPVYENAWELVNSTKTTFQQNAFIASLTRNVFDPSNAIVDSISALTGQPVYRPGTDSVLRNAFNTGVYDLQREDKLYTYFILNNAGFTTETDKLKTFFKTGSVDSTSDLASFAVVKDLIVEGYYTLAQLPAVLTSKFGVKIPVNQGLIVETRKMSNGIAYVISGINFDVKDKIPAVTVQGESYRGFFDASGNPVTPRQNNVSAIFIRARQTPAGEPFVDMFAYNHGISALNAQYRVTSLPSVKYKVYWRVPNDTLIVDRTNAIVPVGFGQRLAMGARNTNFLIAPGTNVAINNFTDVYLGDWTQATYGTLDMFLTAAASTSNTSNRLNLDYIKLVPDL